MVREFLHNTQRKMELINCIRRQEARRNEIIRKEAFSRFLRVVQYVKDCYGEETARKIWNVFVEGDNLLIGEQ